MKKSFIFYFMLIFSTLGFSQTFLLEEYFNDPVKLPTTWTTIDKDGDKQNWRIETADAEIFAVSDSWRSGGIGPLMPVNYLVSPNIDLTGLSGTVTLRYTIRISDPEFFKEHYKVAVSTTGNNATDFKTIVKEETCTADDYYENYPYWHERTVDLSPFIGQHIYLTWCHYNCTNIYNLSLDSIQVIYSTNVNLPDQQESGITLFPNPAKEEISITGAFKGAQIQLFTTDGRQVYQSAEVTKQASINVSRFENGLYFLKIKSQKGIITRKVNISH
jgi:hypothetical protein